MHGPDGEEVRLALEALREDIAAAVAAWRAQGRSDGDLALLVEGRHPGRATVSATSRGQLELTIPDFDPTIAIEFAKHPQGQVPAVVDLHDLVRRVVWIRLGPPLGW
jgi:hypothetical protein